MRLLCFNVGSSLGSNAAKESALSEARVRWERSCNGREAGQMSAQPFRGTGVAGKVAAQSAILTVEAVEALPEREMNLEQSMRQFRLNAVVELPSVPGSLEALPSVVGMPGLDGLVEGREDPEVSPCLELPACSGSLKKRRWTGPRRMKRSPPQAPWTEEQMEGKMEEIVDSILGSQDGCENAVVSVLDSWLGKITRVDLGGLIKILGNEGRPDMALAVFRWMLRQRGRLKPQRHVRSLILGVLGRAGMVSTARELFDTFLETEATNVHFYNAMISAYAHRGKVQQAWELLEDMRERKLRPDEITINTLLSGISRSGASLMQAEALLSVLKQECIQPSTRTYNAMISAFAKAGRLDRVTAVWEEMRSVGVEPDIFTYNTLIASYAKAGNGKLAEALEVLDRLKAAGREPNSVTYCELIQLTSRASQHAKSIKLVDDLRKAGFMQDLTCYTVAINAYGRAGLIIQARELFNHLRQHGLTPNVVTWSAMIQALNNQGMFEEAGRHFDEMLGSGCQPDITLFNIMLTSFTREGLLVKAANVFRQMEVYNVSPDAKSYNAMIQAYCQAGQTQKGRKMYQQMLRAGYNPDKISSTLPNQEDPGTDNTIHTLMSNA